MEGSMFLLFSVERFGIASGSGRVVVL
jgi:hypothetical protein